MESYTVTVDGYSFDHGLDKSVAEMLIELLKDCFPGASCIKIKEL